MNLFYLDIDFNKESIEDLINFHYISNVLRKTKDDIIYYTNGRGNKCECRIFEIKNKKIKLNVIKNTQEKKNLTDFIFAISLLKNKDKMELIVEKLTEIGADKIMFFWSKNCERNNINLDQLKEKSKTAMLQSTRTYLPQITFIKNIENLIEYSKKENYFIYLFHCRDDKKINLSQINKKEKSMFIFGPEGDFTIDEIKLINKEKIKTVSLGEARLKAETAVIFTASNMLSC